MIIQLFFISCHKKDILVQNLEVKVDTISINSLNIPNSMSTLKLIKLFNDNGKIQLWLYSSFKDSIFIFNIGKNIKLSNKFSLIKLSEIDNSRTQIIMPLLKDSLLVLRENSISLVDSKTSNIIYHHSFDDKSVSVLSQFSFPIIDNNNVYCELIEWNAQKLNNGVLDTRITYHLDLNSNKEEYLPVKILSSIYTNSLFKQYCQKFNNDLIYSNSINSEIRIFNIISNKIKTIKLDNSNSIKYTNSNIKNDIDKFNEETVINNLYSNIIVDKNENCFYRMISSGIPKVNDDGLIASIGDKNIEILKYNSKFELISIFNTGLKGFLSDYFLVKNGNIFSLKFDSGNIVLYEFKMGNS